MDNARATLVRGGLAVGLAAAVAHGAGPGACCTSLLVCLGDAIPARAAAAALGAVDVVLPQTTCKTGEAEGGG